MRRPPSTSRVSPSRTRVTFRLTQRPTDRGHADGVGFGVVGGALTPDDGPIERWLATNTAAMTTTETVIEIRTADRRRGNSRQIKADSYLSSWHRGTAGEG